MRSEKGTMPGKLPFEIREAVVAACGRCFWYRAPFRDFLVSCGVGGELYDRYADGSKYTIARNVLAELDAGGEEGWLVQRRIVTELCQLRDVPDKNVPDRDAAIAALRTLKELAVAREIVARTESTAANARAQESRRRQAALAARGKRMEELRLSFLEMTTRSGNPQGRGYDLESLIAELFVVHEIPFRRPYRTGTEQVDGHFRFKEFDYLVEARWRSELPAEADLAAFKIKVDKKLTSTRGLFVSITGFRPEVVLEFTRGISSSIILMDGSDLALILEGQVSLVDALDMKIQKAAQEGIVYFALAQRFT
jgi:hypothetical protein